MFLNEIYDNWLNSTQDFIFFKDIEGKYLSVSKSTAKFAGFSSPSEMIGKYDCEIFSAEIVQAFMTQDKQVIETKKQIVDIDWANIGETEKVLIETIKTPIFDNEENLVGIYGVSRNITNKKTIEQELSNSIYNTQTIIDNIPLPIWIKDKMNCYIMINKEYEKFYGVKREEIIRQGVNKVLRLNHLFALNDIKLLNLQDNEVINNKIIKKIVLKTDEINSRKVHIIKSPIMCGDDECSGLIGICYQFDE